MELKERVTIVHLALVQLNIMHMILFFCSFPLLYFIPSRKTIVYVCKLAFPGQLFIRVLFIFISTTGLSIPLCPL